MLSMKEACISFQMGDEGFGIPLDQITEVVPVGEITPVPLAPASIKGLANLRGRVVTLIELSELVGRPLPAPRLPEDRLALVLAPPHAHLGLFIHAPVEVSAATPQRVLHRSVQAKQNARRIDDDVHEDPTGGPAEADGRILHLLSAGDLVARCERNLLLGFRGKS